MLLSGEKEGRKERKVEKLKRKRNEKRRKGRKGKEMSSVAVVPNSPIFPPSQVSSIFYKSPVSPRIIHVHGPSPAPTSSPLAGRLIQRQITALSSSKKEASPDNMGIPSCSGAVLKRKRPSRIDIPIAPLNFAVDSPKERVDVVEAEADGYSVYCKRGRRGAMEDRYSAVVDLQAESRQVIV